jgi:hypothetical protein
MIFMSRINQLEEFACYFHQDFGDGDFDTLENNIYSFFSSPSYTDGKKFIEQINSFKKIAFSTNGRGSSWLKLGGFVWIKDLNHPQTWEALEILANDYPDCQAVLIDRGKFEGRVNQLLKPIRSAQNKVNP